MQVALNNNMWSKMNRFKFKITNLVLYAEILLNDALCDFSESIRFRNFFKIIECNGLFIDEVNMADSSFYSFYFTLKKRN
jgi:hypothetical protein